MLNFMANWIMQGTGGGGTPILRGFIDVRPLWVIFCAIHRQGRLCRGSHMHGEFQSEYTPPPECSVYMVHLLPSDIGKLYIIKETK